MSTYVLEALLSTAYLPAALFITFAFGFVISKIINSPKIAPEILMARREPLERHDYCKQEELVNETPIIGVMTYNRVFEGYNEYCMAVYSKFVEQCGARAVPIHFYLTDEELEAYLERLNGVIIPGGITKIIDENNEITDFCRKIQITLKKCKELYDRGIHLPIWGVCLGLQGIAVAEAPYYEVLGVNNFDAVDIRINLNIKTDFDETRVHKHLPEAVRTAVQNDFICYDSHHDGVRPEFFTKYEGLRDYKIVATSADRKGVECAAIIEHKKYPIYAVQYHPEKVAFLWKDTNNVPRSINALALARHYAMFFITEAKKSTNKFGDYHEIRRNLLINADLLFTDSNSQDIYVYKSEHGVQAPAQVN